MAKQLNVSLGFTADTSQAKAQIQELQATLNQLAYSGNMSAMTPDLKNAAMAAKELKIHLNNAFDAQTGRFDLSKLDKSLKTSGANLTDLSVKLASAGTTGQQAFAQLAQSIASANQPMFLLNSRLAEMWTVMKNTVRWQLSSSMIHGFIGGVQQAYGYAKDLNESLTNIRIVTGYSTEKMADFAKEANKAAKALSATTTEYTDASLIYYQQGLSEAEVKERADVTIKMANAVGQSAETVSQQMTAIWNNFAESSSKPLEYYADVITALGAATASSSDEIAAGLEKFAGIADMVGLSYKYATAALATITAESREAPETVGTALKTIFARVQGLKLGETLEDGVDLNKYSQALRTVGVEVIESNGELRKMDDILNDLAAKWDTIGESEKTALAQTVAGVRQYNNLVTLLENWDKMEINLDVAENAEGTLTEQQKLYEESWQASIDRVRAASEGIYDSLINDKFFIGLNNGFAEILGGVELFIDGIGGAKGAIIALSTILISSLSHKIPQAIDNLVYNFKFLTKGANEAYSSIQKQMSEAYTTVANKMNQEQGPFLGGKKWEDTSYGTQVKNANDLTAAKTKLAAVSKSMSNAERQYAEMELSIIELEQQRLVTLRQKNEAILESVQAEGQQKMDDLGQKALDTTGITEATSKIISGENYAEQMRQTGSNMITALINGMKENGNKFSIALKDIYKAPLEQLKNINIDNNNYEAKAADIKAFLSTIDEATLATTGLDEVLENLGSPQSVEAVQKDLTTIINALETGEINANNYQSVLKALFGEKKGQALIENFSELIQNEKNAEAITKRLQELLKGFNPVHVVRTSEALGAMAGMAGTAAMAINSIKSLISTWKNPDASGWEQLSSTLMTFSMIVPGIISGMKSLGTITSWSATQALSLALATDVQTAATTLSTLATEAKELATQGKTAAEIKNILIGKLGIATTNSSTIAELLSKAAIDGKNLSLAASVGLWLANTAALSKYVLVQKIAMALMGKFGSLILGAAFIGIGAAIFGIIKGLDALIVTQKEAIEAIETANKAYEEEKNKTQELNDELKTTQDRINELRNKGPLNIIEESELAQLEAAEESLQHQLELQKQIEAAKRAETVEDIVKDYATGASIKEVSDVEWRSGVGIQANMNNSNETWGMTDDQYEAWINAEAKAGRLTAEQEQQHRDALTTSRREHQNEFLLTNAGAMETAKTGFDAVRNAYFDEMAYGDQDQAIYYLEQLKSMLPIYEGTLKATYGDNYAGEILGDFIQDNGSNILTNFDPSQGLSEDLINQLALKGISEDTAETYLADTISAITGAMKDSANFQTEDLSKLSEEELDILLNNLDTLKKHEQEFATIDDLKQYLNESEELVRKTDDQIKAEADAQGVSQAESYGLDVDQFKAYRDLLYETNEELREQPELLNQVAIAQLRLNKGAKTIKDSYSDLSPLIKKAQKELNSKDGKVSAETWSEIAGHINETKTAMEDMFDLDSGALKDLDPEFLVENYDLLAEAAQGSEEAYNKLQAKLASNLLQENFSGIADKYQDFINDITSQKIETGQLFDFGEGATEIGGQLTDMYTAAAQAAYQGGATVAEAMQAANDLMAAIGFQAPDVEMEATEVQVTGDIPDGWQPQPDGTVQTRDADGKMVTVQGVKATLTEGGTYSYTQTILTPKGKGSIAKSSEKVGGGGGSGGGGGGGGSKRDTKAPEGKRYYTLTNQLEDIEEEYDAISKAADRAFGKDKLNLIDKQISKLDEQIEKQKELEQAAKDYMALDKSTMEDLYFKGWDDEETGEHYSFWDYTGLVEDPNLSLPTEIQYDARGNITNYDEIQSAMQAIYEAAAKSGMSDEEFEIFKENYNKFFEDIDQYDESKDKAEEIAQTITDLVNEQIDLKLEKVKYEVELKLDLAEDSLELLEFQLEHLGDSAFSLAESLALLGNQAEITRDQLDANLQGMNDTLKQSGVTDAEIKALLAGDANTIAAIAEKYNFTEEQINTIRDYKSGALDALSAMQDLKEEVQDKLSNAFDELNENLQESQETFNHLNNTLNSYKNIIDIVGKKTLGVTKDLMSSLNETFVNNSINQLNSSRVAWEALQTTEENAKKALEDAVQRGVQSDIDFWTEELKRINKEEESAQEAMLQNWENTLTLIVEQFEAAVEEAVETFNKSFTADGTLLSEAFDIQGKRNERYIQDYEKIYELSKLTRDINNSIDESSSLTNKAKLKELLKEINAYEEEGLQMTEYDVEYLQKKYDLYKAQLALQEAQAAKDTVRLQRNNEGGLSYVYTASNSKVEEAQQEYEDALYAVQELNYEYLEEMEASTIETMEEMGEALAAIKQEDFASLEEYEAEIDRVTKFYMEQISYYQNQMQTGIDRNKQLYEEDWAAYNRITGYKISANENFITSWKETTLGQLTESESETVDIYSRVVDSLDVLITGLLGAYDTMKDDIDEANEAAGSSTDNFAQDAQKALGEVEDESAAAADSVTEMADQMETGFETASTALIKWQTTYSSAMEEAIENTMGVAEAYNFLIETLVKNKIPETKIDYGPGSSSSGGYTGKGKGSTKTGDGDNTFDGPPAPKSSLPEDASRRAAEEEAAKAAAAAAAARATATSVAAATTVGAQVWTPNIKKLFGFSTGGYTGEWGEEGRLALLHQKEIVLNKEDTSNLLNTVSLVRQLAQTIDLNAQAASAGIGKLSAFNFRDERESNILQQEVTIHAEFPNVQHRSEIEEAFNNLINVSAQYAHRK